ncbi:NYN domain-containing protein, partial [Xanthomonas graminis]
MKTRSRSETDDDQPRLAVLIDADNAQPSVIEGLLAEVAKYGVASVKRIYGDFTSTRMTQWKQALLKHSISPVQQFAYTSGKNATDSSLIIDAMDLLYTGRFDGFCLVSSDSDFTRLAQRLREEGPTVYGFGERKTPDAFVQACDKFIYTEVLRSEAASSEPSKPSTPAAKPARKASKAPQAAR